mgnify:CR=1 FL=1
MPTERREFKGIGLWIATVAKGEHAGAKYIQGKILGRRVRIFKNSRKSNDRSPDYWAYVDEEEASSRDARTQT